MCCDHTGILVCLARQEHPDLSAYADPEVVWRLRKNDALRDAFLPSLKRFNPQFDPTWVQDAWVFREAYAQPAPFVNHSRHIPPTSTPLPGLFFASMSQVYPWDRGTNYAIKLGREVAAAIHAAARSAAARPAAPNAILPTRW
ncbi:MAG: FAD-dependent oxidoreductase [Anaerolineae bacterium]